MDELARAGDWGDYVRGAAAALAERGHPVVGADLFFESAVPVGAGLSSSAALSVVAVYQATRHLQFQGVVTRFLPGGFVERTFVAKGFGFYSLTALYRF